MCCKISAIVGGGMGVSVALDMHMDQQNGKWPGIKSDMTAGLTDPSYV